MLAGTVPTALLLPARPQVARRGRTVRVSAKVGGDAPRVQRAVRVRRHHHPIATTASTAWRVREESDERMCWLRLICSPRCVRNVCGAHRLNPKPTLSTVVEQLHVPTPTALRACGVRVAIALVEPQLVQRGRWLQHHGGWCVVGGGEAWSKPHSRWLL